MRHPDEGVWLAFADHELDVPARQAAEAHLVTCVACQRTVRELREAMHGVAVECAMRDAREPEAWHATAPTPRRVPRPVRLHLPREREGSAAPARRVMRWAAILLVAVSGGAAALVAPRWRSLVGGDTARHPTTAADASGSAPASAATARTVAAAVSIAPAGGSATIAVTLVSGRGRVVVRPGARADVQVTVTTVAGGDVVPRFVSGDGTLDVQLAGGTGEAQIEVEVPTLLRTLRVVQGGVVVASIRDGVVSPAAVASTGVLLAPAAPR